MIVTIEYYDVLGPSHWFGCHRHKFSGPPRLRVQPLMLLNVTLPVRILASESSVLSGSMTRNPTDLGATTAVVGLMFDSRTNV